MKIYVINSSLEDEKTKFSVELSDHLSKDKKVLLVATKRNLDLNIEDYFNKDGMITYDIADYFTKLAPLSMVIVKESDNLDFIISPLLEDKYSYNSSDFESFLTEINYDYIIIDGIDVNLLADKTSLEIISADDVMGNIDSDLFFIKKVKKDIDIREYKEKIDNMSSKYLGYVGEDKNYSPIIDNLLSEKTVDIPKIGFFERLKASFKR